MSDVDTYLKTPPKLAFAFSVRVIVGPIQDLGQTARGHRRIIDILGGTAEGPRFQGEILPGGADWQIVRADGTIEVVARYTIRSASGALVYVQNDGLRVALAGHASCVCRGGGCRSGPRPKGPFRSLVWRPACSAIWDGFATAGIFQVKIVARSLRSAARACSSGSNC